MRVLIVNTFYYPNMQGGAEQSVKLLAENFLKHGNTVAIYCADAKDGKKTVEEINGVTVYRCTTGKFDLYKYSYKKNSVSALEKVTQKLRCYYNPDCVKDFEEICDRFKPDVIHTNTLYGIPCSVWKAAHRKEIAVVHTIRDTAILSPVQHGHKVSPLVVKAHQKYMCSVSKYVDAVTAPSEYTLRTSLATGAFDKSKVKECVFNSVQIDYDLLHRMVEERKARTSPCIKFMYAGRLIYLKGIRQMLEAFSKIEDENCELHICGTGDMVDYVKEQAQKDSRIIYHGKLNSEELAKQYKDCDVLLFPSVWPEPFGRVFIEGNMYGMPVIAGDCGGIPEIHAVTHGGDLCDCDKIENLTKRMKLYLNRDYINHFYESIVNNIMVFDIEKQIESFEKIYNEIITFLKGFAELMQMKIIIMSATLPNLDILTDNHCQTIRLIENREKYFNHPKFARRVVADYSLLEQKMTMEYLTDEIVKKAGKNKKVLIEFIRKRSAEECYRILCEKSEIPVFLMTGDSSILDRKRMIRKIEALDSVILVATQVVEAGVDIDMDIGYKDISRLDSEEQFMGRINRSGRKSGIVYFFDLDNAEKIYSGDKRIEKDKTLVNKEMRELLTAKNFPAYYENGILPLVLAEKKKCNDENIEDFFQKTVGNLDMPKVDKRMQLINDNRLMKSVYLGRIIQEENGEELDGRFVWDEYKQLIEETEMEYSERKVKLHNVRSKMNAFIYQFSCKAEFMEDEQIGELYYIENGEAYFDENDILRRELFEEGKDLFI